MVLRLLSIFVLSIIVILVVSTVGLSKPARPSFPICADVDLKGTRVGLVCK